MASPVREMEPKAIKDSNQSEGTATERQPEPQPAARRTMKNLVSQRPVLSLLALLIIFASAASLWLYLGSYEKTDDAQVDGHLHPISARINGTILNINPDVQNNHYVQAGTVLAEIDPADYAAELARAQADFDRLQASASSAREDVSVISVGSNSHLDLAQAQLREAGETVVSEKAALQATEARVAVAEANFSRAESDRQRYERLLAKREISQSEYDRIATEASTDQATLIAARADVNSARSRIEQAQSRLAARNADLLAARSAPQQISSSRSKAVAAVSEAGRAKAQLTTAHLNLGYTKIIAPVSGIIGRKSVEIGQRVQSGQQLMTIIAIDDVWITANFKETQLRKMKPGQPVTVHVDAFDHDYHGYVDSIGGATGSIFSLLPPENATGNFVKVVQRVPVKIYLNQGENTDHRLRPGMSVEPEVKIR